MPLLWRHNGCDGVSNHQPHDCLLNRSFGRRSKKTSKLRVTGLCVENSPLTGEFSTQMASNAENVSIWWRHHSQHNCRVSIVLQDIICAPFEMHHGTLSTYWITPYEHDLKQRNSSRYKWHKLMPWSGLYSASRINGHYPLMMKCDALL